MDIRKSFARIGTAIPFPDFLEEQRRSFERLIQAGAAPSEREDVGLQAAFQRAFPVRTPDGRFDLHFSRYSIEKPIYTPDHCMEKKLTYGSNLSITVRLAGIDQTEHDIPLGIFPLMTETGSFIVNGVEKVVVNQIHRSPGIYFTKDEENLVYGKPQYSATIIPHHGSWIDILFNEKKGRISAQIDKGKELPVAVLLKAFGYSSRDILNAGCPAETERLELYALFQKLFSREYYDLSKAGRLRLNRRLGLDIPLEEGIIRKEDLMAALMHLLRLREQKGSGNDMECMSNRRVRLAGEILEHQIGVGLQRMKKEIRESFMLSGKQRPWKMIKAGTVMGPLHGFMSTSPLCQFAAQENPLSGLSHRRRITTLGPGGVSRENVKMEIRDIHKTQYGRLCPIESPEGQNVGLVLSPAVYAKINEYGFLTTPYRVIVNGRATDEIKHLSADEEKDEVIAEAGELHADGILKNKTVYARRNGEAARVGAEEVTLMDVSPGQILSPATSLIPFFGHNDGHRSLMGCNMQRQAVPLLKPEAPLVGTGIERAIARDTGAVVRAKDEGMVEAVDASHITICRDNGLRDTYSLTKFQRTNAGTCWNFRPVVSEGDRVKKGDPIADGPSCQYGEIALGRNLLVAFMPWHGFNFEDSIIISERLLKEDMLTSLHFDEYETDVFETLLGNEVITKDIPNRGADELSILDENGIAEVGTRIKAGDILVGKIAPRHEEELTPEEMLLRTIFGESAKDVKDESLIVNHGTEGVVVEIKVLDSDKGDILPDGVIKRVRVIIGDKKKIMAGDKLAGRYGNKGVVSKIVPVEDMPFLADGTPVDVVLNPCGVPSRMNIGQIFEAHLGMAMRVLGQEIRHCLKQGSIHEIKYKLKEVYCDLATTGLIENLSDEDAVRIAKRLSNGVPIAVPPFDGATVKDIEEYLNKAWLPLSGQFTLYDGRTGEPFTSKVTVGVMYMLKLCHMVDHKVHARSVGTYSAVTQQPLKGRAKFGGQRIGEMEVWALYAHGAAHTLQEMLTVKSDDVKGRIKAFEAIVKGTTWENLDVPESFNVLVKELQALCLDVEMVKGK